MEYDNDSVFIGQHTACIANEYPENKFGKKRRSCNSSDALSIYEHENIDGTLWYDATCWSCKQYFTKDEVHSSRELSSFLGVNPENGLVKDKQHFENKATKKSKITNKEVKELWDKTGGKDGQSGNGYRGHSDWVLKFYGFRIEYDRKGEVKAIYYPETVDGKLSGYKSRHLPKKFGYNNYGKTGISSDLSGQCRFPDGGKYCVPMDTQILTKTGWKYFDEIIIGEIVLGYDKKTNTKKWTKVTEKHYFAEDDVFQFGNGLQKLRSTSNHRWYVGQRKDGGSDGRYYQTEVRTIKDFTSETNLIVNAPFEETVLDDHDNICYLSKNKKENHCSKVLDMTHDQRVAWLDGFMLADGHLIERGDPHWMGSQNRGEIFEAVLLCSYMVHDKIIRVKESKPNYKGNIMGHVTLSNSKYRSGLKNSIEFVGKEPVWCVTTELDSWVMKQEDTINITGNCLIVGGEEDIASAQDMLREYQKKKGQEDYSPYAVVSPTTGEPSAAKQCRRQYEWFDKFDIIIIGMDNDEVGQEAAEEIAEVLPKEKVRIAAWSGKDPNNMHLQGNTRQFWSDFFGARELISSGITSSSSLRDKIKKALVRPRIGLPPEMLKLQEATKGDGFITNRIYNLIGDTSTGKTTFINTMSHFWFFLKDFKVGVVSLEASDGEYGIDILSYHLKKNLYWGDEEYILDYLDEPEIVVETNKLLTNEYGEERFVVLDDREGTIESLQSKMEQMKRQYGCNIIIVDVATDFLRTLTQEQQAMAYNWQSNFVKEGVTIFNVLHTRKQSSNRDGIPKKPDEYDALGSSIFVQKAAGNLIIYRNKLCKDDPIEQNSTYWDVPKMRQGSTGDKTMVSYYDADTKAVYDREKFFEMNPDKLPVGYDLSVSSFDKAYYQEGGRGFKGEEGSKFRKPSLSNEPEDDFDIVLSNGFKI